MLLYILLAVLIVIGIGLVVRHVVNSANDRYMNITNFEFLWTSLLIMLLVVPGVIYTGWHISKNNQMTYVEHFNGWETACNRTVTRCYRDGPCRWSYKCDPYIVMVSYSCGTGKRPRTCTRPETRYHDCPYAKEEWNYSVATTIGEFTIDDHRLPFDYVTNPWRSGNYAPDNVARSAGVGHPKFWLEAQARLAAGNGGPVTKLHTYENYVLASQMTILKTSVKADIDEFLKDKLLPNIEREIDFPYLVNKVYAMRVSPPPEFKDRVHRLSASLGHLRQSDIRVVLVNDAKVNGNPDRYVNALQSYWQSRALQQSNHALPKNALVVVMGTDGKTVLWSRAFTGMPVGNEGLIAQLNVGLSGKMLHTDTLIGHLRHRAGAQLALDTMGVVSYLSLVQKPGMQREHMSFYSYLRGDIQPTQAAKVWSTILAVILGGLLWLIPVHLHCFTEGERTLRYKTYNPYRRF